MGRSAVLRREPIAFPVPVFVLERIVPVPVTVFVLVFVFVLVVFTRGGSILWRRAVCRPRRVVCPVGKGRRRRGRRGFRWWSPGRVFGRGVGFVRGGHADVRAETHDAKTEGVRIAPDARVASSETVEPAAVAPRRFPERGPVHLGIRARRPRAPPSRGTRRSVDVWSREQSPRRRSRPRRARASRPASARPSRAGREWRDGTDVPASSAPSRDLCDP